MALISVAHLRKSFDGVAVLKDVNAEIEKGEVISIIGPSGTGKSTFLRCLNRLETPDGGTIVVGGVDVTAPDAAMETVKTLFGAEVERRKTLSEESGTQFDNAFRFLESAVGASQELVLFATENEKEYRDRGWYDHGLYPFVFDPLFRVAGTPCGFGYIDVAKSAQEYIDRGNQALMTNLLVNARPRCFIRSDGSVNEEEYADLSRDFVHVEGGLGQDSILPIRSTGLNVSDEMPLLLRQGLSLLREKANMVI